MTISYMSTRQLENGEREGDPPARFPQAMFCSWVIRFKTSSAKQYRTFDHIRTSQPFLMESAPFAQQLLGPWALDRLVRFLPCILQQGQAWASYCMLEFQISSPAVWFRDQHASTCNHALVAPKASLLHQKAWLSAVPANQEFGQ